MNQLHEDRQAAALLERGRRALACGEWQEAVSVLADAIRIRPDDAVAWESRANAHMWLQQTTLEIEARQQAYALYRQQGDDASAARVCLDLVWDYVEMRGEPAVANGWFQRARRLLDTLPPAPEHALLAVFDAYMVMDANPAEASAHATRAATLAEEAGARDMATLALALHGLALVGAGKVARGMACLDEAVAAAIGREITDPQWYYFTCCCMIDACDRVRDFGRSLEWCDQLRAFAERWQVQAMLTSCRIRYTGALLWRGEWHQCERELRLALDELGAEQPGLRAGAVVRLAELRRRQGRLADAAELLEAAAAHPAAVSVRAAMALDRGDAAAAAELGHAALRRTPASATTARLAALELVSRAAAQLGDTDSVEAAAVELEKVAGAAGTPALRAAALVARARVLRLSGNVADAAEKLVDAAHLLETAGSPPEAARARIELAAVLRDDGRHDRADAQLAAAVQVLEGVGAGADLARAAALREAPAGPAGRPSAMNRRGVADLTRRQRQVLALVADGLSDRDIAERLCLSEHTVHRHVANAFQRLGVSTRTAAVAHAIRAGMI